MSWHLKGELSTPENDMFHFASDQGKQPHGLSPVYLFIKEKKFLKKKSQIFSNIFFFVLNFDFLIQQCIKTKYLLSSSDECSQIRSCQSQGFMVIPTQFTKYYKTSPS